MDHWKTKWRSVVFSDESRLCFGASDGRVLVRRSPRERLQPNCLWPSHIEPTPGVCTDDEPIHWFCPTNPNTWCKYNAAINNNLQNYKHKPSVAKAVQDVIKPVFADLSHPALLKKCLGDNDLIWRAVGGILGTQRSKDVLVSQVKLFRGTIGQDFIFIDDNTRAHRVNLVEIFLERGTGYFPEECQQIHLN
ncbi:transposable element Tc1 transposase [Trichonephila clavipes]|nr:transposable element Tc1 transposase [Trichonephila clavipes]